MVLQRFMSYIALGLKPGDKIIILCTDIWLLQTMQNDTGLKLFCRCESTFCISLNTIKKYLKKM